MSVEDIFGQLGWVLVLEWSGEEENWNQADYAILWHWTWAFGTGLRPLWQWSLGLFKAAGMTRRCVRHDGVHGKDQETNRKVEGEQQQRCPLPVVCVVRGRKKAAVKAEGQGVVDDKAKGNTERTVCV